MPHSGAVSSGGLTVLTLISSVPLGLPTILAPMLPVLWPDEEIQDASNTHVRLLPLPYPPNDKRFTQAQAQAAVDELKRQNIDFDPERTVWLGHDFISGAAANEAARVAGGRSALIHHMSYDHYESFAEDSATAYEKKQIQTTLFQQADLVLAVGPLLRDALDDRIGGSKQVSMLVPGLAEIDLRPTPKTFSAFLSGLPACLSRCSATNPCSLPAWPAR